MSQGRSAAPRTDGTRKGARARAVCGPNANASRGFTVAKEGVQ